MSWKYIKSSEEADKIMKDFNFMVARLYTAEPRITVITRELGTLSGTKIAVPIDYRFDYVWHVSEINRILKPWVGENAGFWGWVKRMCAVS